MVIKVSELEECLQVRSGSKLWIEPACTEPMLVAVTWLCYQFGSEGLVGSLVLEALIAN